MSPKKLGVILYVRNNILDCSTQMPVDLFSGDMKQLIVQSLQAMDHNYQTDDKISE